MCSIIGIISKNGKDVYPQVLDLLYSMIHRGPDAFGINVGRETIKSEQIRDLSKEFISGDIGLGHGRLAVTGEGIQPIDSKNSDLSVVHNGEIYNYQELNSDSSDSTMDSETILKYFLSGSFKKNAEKFMRDAVGNYAIGLRHKDTLYAIRDIVGIRPLWFGENDSYCAFASEPNALKKLDITFPEMLLPGHMLKLTKKGIISEKVFDLDDFRKLVPKKTSFEKFKETLYSSVAYRTKGLKKAGVLFSAGVDSTVVAKIVSENVKDTRLYTAGADSCQDIKFSEKVSDELGLKLHVRTVEKDEIPDYCLKTLKTLSFFDEMQLQIGLPIYVACEAAKKDGAKIIFSGQGSDEIFAGYSNYKKILKNQGYNAVEDKIWASLNNIWNRNLFRDDIVAMRHSLELRVPLLDLNFLKEAMAIPASEKILSHEDEIRKHPIRNLAKEIGLPELVHQRPKKALQYGSGLGKEIDRIFRIPQR